MSDKVADRIAGAIVDYAYTQQENPKIAVEVMIGHGVCHIIAESSVNLPNSVVYPIVSRIAGENVGVDCVVVPQDVHLADNQNGSIRCGDNGIFKGTPVTYEQMLLTQIADTLYKIYGYDGKYLIAGDKLTICQSYADSDELRDVVNSSEFRSVIDRHLCTLSRYIGVDMSINEIIVNPLGDWTGGTDVDTGCTNRKLGSDMGDSVTGGGIVGKDLSKADVSVNIYAWLKAQETGKKVELSCSIGDETVDGKPYEEIVKIARDYIKSIGGFEKFAEWGLIRPQYVGD